jgi:hypothetical protein
VIYVFAPKQRQANDWFRRQGLRPRDVCTFGDHSSGVDYTVLRTGDRVVVLGELSWQADLVLDLLLKQARAAGQEVAVQRLPPPWVGVGVSW